MLNCAWEQVCSASLQLNKSLPMITYLKISYWNSMLCLRYLHLFQSVFRRAGPSHGSPNTLGKQVSKWESGLQSSLWQTWTLGRREKSLGLQAEWKFSSRSVPMGNVLRRYFGISPPDAHDIYRKQTPGTHKRNKIPAMENKQGNQWCLSKKQFSFCIPPVLSSPDPSA